MEPQTMEKLRTDLTRGHDVIRNAFQEAGFQVEVVSPGAINPKIDNINEPVIWGIQSPDGTSLSLTLNVTP